MAKYLKSDIKEFKNVLKEMLLDFDGNLIGLTKKVSGRFGECQGKYSEFVDSMNIRQLRIVLKKMKMWDEVFNEMKNCIEL